MDLSGVVSIGESVFYICENLKTVKNADHIESLGASAFKRSSLEGDFNKIFPSLRTIGAFTFENTKFTSIVLDQNFTFSRSISSFRGIKTLTNLYIDCTLPSWDSSSDVTFGGCTITKVTLGPNFSCSNRTVSQFAGSTIWEVETFCETVPSFLFESTGPKTRISSYPDTKTFPKITLHNTKIIGDSAFRAPGGTDNPAYFQTLSIPETVQSVGIKSFAYNSSSYTGGSSGCLDFKYDGDGTFVVGSEAFKSSPNSGSKFYFKKGHQTYVAGNDIGGATLTEYVAPPTELEQLLYRYITTGFMINGTNYTIQATATPEN